MNSTGNHHFFQIFSVYYFGCTFSIKTISVINVVVYSSISQIRNENQQNISKIMLKGYKMKATIKSWRYVVLIMNMK